MKSIITSLSIVVATIGSSVGQDPAPAAPETAASPEAAAVAANDRAFEAAYAKADVKALVEFFAEDVSYTTEDGRVLNGRAAIEDSFKASFAKPENKGAKLVISLDAARLLAPEVVVENGSTTVLSTNGDDASAMFTAIHVKKDGKWKISQLVETPLPATTPGEHLGELSWLIGGWTESDKEDGVTVSSRYQWSQGGNFISRNISVKRGDKPVLDGWQIIGWNPVDESIRSWTFDDAGGFSEGTWTREGERWLVREIGYASDGGRTTSDSTLSKVSDDRVYWESNNRTLDGEPQPGIGRIEITKVKGE